MAIIISNSGTCAASERLRDPTEPANYAVIVSDDDSGNAIDPNDNIVLEAVVISGNKRLAIINDNILKVGDEIGDKEVMSIETHSVTLSDGIEEDMILRLSGKSIKETSE